MTEARFEPRGYLRFDLAKGLVEARDRGRHLVVPAEVLAAAGSEEGLVEAARRWGRELGKALADLADEDALSETPERLVTDLAHLLATLGFGRCELESWGGVLFAVVDGAPTGAGRDVLAGLLAGVFQAMASERFECVPVQDEAGTRFLLCGAEGIDLIKGWVSSGARPGEVVQRMLAGEHLGDGARG